MNTLKFFSVAALLAVGTSSAFASELDGKSDNAWLAQTHVSQPAPAPTASAVDAKTTVKIDATAQQGGSSDYLMP